MTDHFNKLHGHTANGKSSKTYEAWSAMRKRCQCPTHRAFRHYGGRGIKICDGWSQFSTFLTDMGVAPAGHSLERRDNNLGYSRDNCYWATSTQQNRNKRTTDFVNFEGVRTSVADLAERFGLNPRTLRTRIKDLMWDIEKAVTTPVRRGGSQK